MIEKIRGKVKETFNSVNSFFSSMFAYLKPILACVVFVMLLSQIGH